MRDSRERLEACLKITCSVKLVTSSGMYFSMLKPYHTVCRHQIGVSISVFNLLYIHTTPKRLETQYVLTNKRGNLMECNLLQKCFKRESKVFFFFFSLYQSQLMQRSQKVGSKPRFQGLVCSTSPVVLISFLTKLFENTEGFVFKKYVLSWPMHQKMSAVQVWFGLIL